MNGTISDKAQKRRGKDSPCSPVVAKSSPATQSSATSGGALVKSNLDGWCKGLGDCLILGPKVSCNIKLAQAPQYHHPRRQRHRFVLQPMGACLDPPDHGWIVTNVLAMTLKDLLHGPGKRRKQRAIPLPPFKERLIKAMEIAQGMQYLHEHKPMVIHRDLKPSNIFLDDSMHVRISDFGHARFLNDEDKALTGETFDLIVEKSGTYVYMAQEVIRSEPNDEKSDVYSFGIILNEHVTGDYPYIETDYGPSKIALEVAEKGLRPELPEQDEPLEELIQLSWDEDVACDCFKRIFKLKD
ncbi:hypothetical protein RND71_008382 [Anisodus tanguticus]|uniref:Protein kinase domain-containing protein n=1 Tax=Anisodus tanguticus TaxID=243964 RepID=A0AAE1VJX6_9SOLA|nr:hypothetical protein RND71_008382 [Anisodus tanguticus]